RNVLHSTLREMAMQIELLMSLLERSQSGIPSLIPLVDPLSDDEARKTRYALTKVHESIREMCVAFEIKLEPLRVRGKVHTDRVYLRVGFEGIRPERLRAYGSLDKEDEELLTLHVEHILAELKEL
ncbi:MAG TPA: hypothetical protein VL126_06425, partial [Bacteroidota bacterium]|nr:hypothetical protein [Bacteroidota bacterium]